MAELPKLDEQPNRLQILQQRVSLGTWLLALLLSTRGLLDFYGMKEPSSFELVIRYITDPFVQLFTFSQFSQLQIPAMDVFFAVTFIMFASYIVQLYFALMQRRHKDIHYVLFEHMTQQRVQTKN